MIRPREWVFFTCCERSDFYRHMRARASSGHITAQWQGMERSPSTSPRPFWPLNTGARLIHSHGGDRPAVAAQARGGVQVERHIRVRRLRAPHAQHAVLHRAAMSVHAPPLVARYTGAHTDVTHRSRTLQESGRCTTWLASTFSTRADTGPARLRV